MGKFRIHSIPILNGTYYTTSDYIARLGYCLANKNSTASKHKHKTRIDINPYKPAVLKVRQSRNDLITFYEIVLSSKIGTNGVRPESLYNIYITGMCQRGRQGGHVPPQILADQKAPPAAPARRLTKCPPRFLDFGTCL